MQLFITLLAILSISTTIVPHSSIHHASHFPHTTHTHVLHYALCCTLHLSFLVCLYCMCLSWSTIHLSFPSMSTVSLFSLTHPTVWSPLPRLHDHPESNVIRVVRESGLQRVLATLDGWEKLERRHQCKMVRATLATLSHVCDSSECSTVVGTPESSFVFRIVSGLQFNDKDHFC